MPESYQYFFERFSDLFVELFDENIASVTNDMTNSHSVLASARVAGVVKGHSVVSIYQYLDVLRVSL